MASVVSTCALAYRPAAFKLRRITSAASAFRSIKMHPAAPRLRASIPSWPEPAKRSMARRPSISNCMAENRPSFTRSAVGLVSSPGRVSSRRPRAVPVITLIVSRFTPPIHGMAGIAGFRQYPASQHLLSHQPAVVSTCNFRSLSALASTASCTAASNPPRTSARTPSMVVPPGEQTASMSARG